MILEQFDKNKKAIINASDVLERKENFPSIGVSCFSLKLVESVVSLFPETKVIAEISNANGKVPVYELHYKGYAIAFFMSRVGASACVASYEDIVAYGLETLILFGTCGVLDKEIEDCSVIVPTSAIRDEGTSYHYYPSSDEISVNENYVDVFEKVLEEHKYSHTKGKVWTTDACYRETREKMKKRKDDGCVCVDMECSAMSAASKFLEKEFFQFFYATDNLDTAVWDSRSLGNDVLLDEKQKIALLALELAVKLYQKKED